MPNTNNISKYQIHNPYKRKRNYLSFLNTANKIELVNGNNNNIRIEKNNLLDVDTLANELLKTKSEDELKKVLLPQLLLLDHKKRKDKTIEEMKQVIDMLDRDKNDLIKCQKGVVRALNKKINSNNQLNITVRGLEDEINKINGNINYYQSLGDSYKSAMNELSQIY
jgi:hypothetical protein